MIHTAFQSSGITPAFMHLLNILNNQTIMLSLFFNILKQYHLYQLLYHLSSFTHFLLPHYPSNYPASRTASHMILLINQSLSYPPNFYLSYFIPIQ